MRFLQFVQFLVSASKGIPGGSETSFPLKNLKAHQVTLVRNAHERGALAGLLVEFKKPAPASHYFLTWPVLSRFWSSFHYGANGRASIPRSVFDTACVVVPKKGAALDLVAAIECLAGGVVAPAPRNAPKCNI